MGYDFTEIKTYGGQVVRTIATCRHDEKVPVESVVDGLVLAYLCPDCDRQFPAEWQVGLLRA
jgi:hypothetical protein